jgi:hypothetical protein
VKACVLVEDFTNVVKVWIYNDVPEGRIYMWPMGYPDPSHKSMTWQQEIVAHEQGIPDTIRPALEMSRPIWDAFKAALLADTQMRLDAIDIVAKTLEREQTRVDVMLDAVLNILKTTNMPQYLVPTTVTSG